MQAEEARARVGVEWRDGACGNGESSALGGGARLFAAGAGKGGLVFVVA